MSSPSCFLNSVTVSSGEGVTVSRFSKTPPLRQGFRHSKFDVHFELEGDSFNWYNFHLNKVSKQGRGQLG